MLNPVDPQPYGSGYSGECQLVRGQECPRYMSCGDPRDGPSTRDDSW